MPPEWTQSEFLFWSWFVIRQHCLQSMKMRPIITNVTWSVCPTKRINWLRCHLGYVQYGHWWAWGSICYMGAWIPPGKGAILGGHLPSHCNVWCREFVVLALQKRTSRSSCRLGLRLRCVHVVGESLDQRRGNLGGRVGSCPPSYNIGWVASVFCPPKKFSNIYPVDWKVQRQCR